MNKEKLIETLEKSIQLIKKKNVYDIHVDKINVPKPITESNPTPKIGLKTTIEFTVES